MNRLVPAFVLLLLCSSTPSYAALWIPVASSVDKSDFFVDARSILKDRETVTYWYRVNHGRRLANGTLSSKNQMLVDCKRRQQTFRYIIQFDGVNNVGNVLNQLSYEDDWEPVVPDTPFWEMMLFVCRK
jgi:hypothetical protein